MDFFVGFEDLTASFNSAISVGAELAGNVMAVGAILAVPSAKNEQDYVKIAAKSILARML